MEQIDKLNELQEQYKLALSNFKECEKITASKLINILKQHCCPEGVEMVVDFTMDTTWRNEDHGRYYFGAKVGFKTDDEKRLAKGWLTDFGSDFDLRIYEKGGIEINKGTCGSYGRKDKFQVARDLCLAKIWENEDILVGCMTSNFNYELYNIQFDLYCEIARINADIKQAEEQRKRDEALKTLRGAKYLFKYSTREKNEYDDEAHNWKVVGKMMHFYDIFVIDKITDKCVLGRYLNYQWDNKRLDIGSVLYQLMNGQISVANEKPEDYEITEEAGE